MLTVEELKNIPVLILYFVKDLSRICFKLKVYRKGSETNAKKKKVLNKWTASYSFKSSREVKT